MLKLEKARDNEIRIGLQGKNPFFNSILLYAFAAAAGIHLFAFILFRIAPYFIIDDRVLPPISVETDLNANSTSENRVITSLSGNEGDPWSLLIPPFSDPLLPNEVNIRKKKDMHDLAHEEPFLHSFVGVEENWDYMISSSRKRTRVSSLQVNISGLLADQVLIANGSDAQVSIEHPFRAIYAVQVDGKTGKVFWHQLKQFVGLQKMQQQAEMILESIQFQERAQMIVDSGEIEIIFNPIEV